MMKGLLAQVEKEVAIRGIDDSLASEVVRKIPALKNRRVVGGYGSVTIVDREGHKITKEALVEATTRFMDEVYYKNVQIFHSDVTIGRVLPAWTNPKTGETIKTHVDDMGWYVVCLAPETQIRTTQGYKNITEVKIGDKVYTHLCGKSFPVTQVMERDVDEEIAVIYLAKQKIRITKEHPILTKRGWIKAGEIVKGDICLHTIDTTDNDRSKYKENAYKMIKNKKDFSRKGINKKHTKPEYLNLPEYLEYKKSYTSNQFIKDNSHTYEEAYGIEKTNEIKNKQTPYKVSGNKMSKKYFVKINGNVCEACGKQHLIGYGLNIHHIDENRFNNSVENWKILCAKCHSATKEHNNQFMGKPLKSAYKELRKLVYARDDNKCVNCGETNKIVAHHFLPVQSIDAMVTLCRKCHRMAHTNKTLLPAGIQNGTVVRWVSTEHYKGKVYNLEVEKAHSYSGKNIIFHNCEIRDDVEIADKVWEEVERGNIRSFSIAGSSKSKTEDYENGRSTTLITKLDIYEITLCEEPVNPMSKFDFFYSPNEAWM